MPDYLRTKPEPTAEQRMLAHEQKVCWSLDFDNAKSFIWIDHIFPVFVFSPQANSIQLETANKQVQTFTKVITHVFDMVKKAREDWDVEASARAGMQQTTNLSDTHALVAAIGMGKALVPDSGPANIPVRAMPAAAAPAAIGKAPSAIKTNIKSANQIHPYSR